MLNLHPSQKLLALRSSLREARASIYLQARAPVFRRALAAQTRADLAVIDLAVEHAQLRERGISSKRPRTRQQPGERTISDSLHAADQALGHDDLWVAVPDDDDRPTRLDRVMDEWRADGWPALVMLDDLLRLAAYYPVCWSPRTRRGRCQIPCDRGRSNLRAFHLNEAGTFLALDIVEVGPTVYTSRDPEQRPDRDEGYWLAARRDDVPERLLDHGPQADMKIGPQPDAPQPVHGPDVDEHRFGHPYAHPDEERWADVAYDALVADPLTVRAQPDEDAVLLARTVDENTWLASRWLYRGAGYAWPRIPAAAARHAKPTRREPIERVLARIEPPRPRVEQLRRAAWQAKARLRQDVLRHS